jgi:hypothetical protein
MRLLLTYLLLLVLSGAALAQSTKAPAIIPAGYTVETIATPKDKKGVPLYFDVGGIDFSDDGTAYIASRLHGIWTYKSDQWKLFAEGLHDPQGIYLTDAGSLVVAHKPELTEIKDIDQDGSADSFRCLSDAWRYAGNYCEYIHGPVVDKKGNYYVSINLAHIGDGMAAKLPVLRTGNYMGSTLGYDGWAAQITPKGEFVPFAPGLRSAAGIGITPDDEILITDNQGEWVPTSCLYHIQKDKFYGHPSSLLDREEYRTGDKKDLIYDADHLKTIRTLPALWFPHGQLMNSPGNPVFDTTEGRFGAFAGQIFIGDQTRSNIVRASLQKVNGEYQGVVFNFIDHLQCGCIRIAFSPDGELWVGQTGRGWRSKGPVEYGLQKIIWDGETTPFEIKTIKLTKRGFRVEFTRPADLSKFTSDNIKVAHWTYNYHKAYGSPQVDLTSEEPRLIAKSDDGLSLEFEVNLVPERLYQISLDAQSPTGERPTVNQGYYTLNHLIE